MRRALFVAAAIVAVCVACGSPAATTADKAREIEGRVWSPYCPGRLLVDCTTQQARALRESIETRLERGQSSDEVLRWLRRDFGDEILAQPPGIAIWAVPIAVFVVGAVIVFFLVRRWTQRGPPTVIREEADL